MQLRLFILATIFGAAAAASAASSPQILEARDDCFHQGPCSLGLKPFNCRRYCGNRGYDRISDDDCGSRKKKCCCKRH
ncbi:hypothetical protein XA68_16879 [Ophiocordyceps unilateralis]|uniref:Invertebrate defensins family profile domain-containing protein n=1 Tax=Ophiocordyceps unilateralis TaxID=268505 RepID=A0A2A9P457_OPHUN|nr:hypothetical protein XA68_16879 [Ophiocordyceps unilateralis]